MESALADLLAELSAIQSDLLVVLADKRHRLLDSDTAAMEALHEREAELIVRLQACQDRRLALLAQAATEGMPSRDLQSLTAALPSQQRSKLAPQMREAAARMRLLQHHSLTNWVLVQRTLIHLSQVLEIIATGGRLQPTYGKDDSVNSGGFLVDQAAWLFWPIYVGRFAPEACAMSLFSSIQIASNSLQIQQIGLQVAGQNIANASTPGYSREELQLEAGPTQRVGGLLLGTGARIQTIRQDVDQFLDERVRRAQSDQSGTALSTQTYQQLESLFGQLNSSNLGTSLTDFTSSIAQVLNSPQDIPTRNLAVLKGESLTANFNSLAQQANDLRAHLNDQIVSDAGDVNNLLTEVGKLNVQIAEAEGGNTTPSQAVGLRDQRDQALSNLSKLLNVTTTQQPDGSVYVYSGGDYLVAGGSVRLVKIDRASDRGLQAASIRPAETDSPLPIDSGEIGGLIDARDHVMGGFLDQLNSFAGTLAQEFNRIYSTGQGLNGYRQVTGTNPVADVNAPLDAAGLKNPPTSGTFQVLVYNKRSGLTQTTSVQVAENGLNNDTTLANLATQLNSIGGLTATTTPDGKLTIATSSADDQVAFAGDTSGVLAALGINTFFTGSDALNISLNQAVVNDSSLFAASGGGVGADTDIAQQLAQFQQLPLASQNGATISNLYDQMAANVTQGSNVAKSVSDGASTFAASLAGQQQAISGVNIDEEAVNMLQYQRGFQASAKLISTLNELLDLLVRL